MTRTSNSPFGAAIQLIEQLESVWQEVTRGYQHVQQAVGAARTVVQLLFQFESAAGTRGTCIRSIRGRGRPFRRAVSGACRCRAGDRGGEPAPLVVDLVGFQYRHKPGTLGTAPGHAAAVAGDANRPHYGVGGFFHFSPSDRTLAAPAGLTIRYLDAEIAAEQEASLAVYRWNDVSQAWDRVGGAVDAAANAVTVQVNRLGLYTVAPALPVGSISMTPDLAAGGTFQNPTSIATFTSDVLRLNTGAIVPDGRCSRFARSRAIAALR